MRVDAINENKFKISLTDNEIELLFGEYSLIDYNEPKAKLAIDMLISEALPESMVPLKCDKVLIEVKQTLGGCNIYFTQLFNSKKSKVNAKSKETYTLVFKNSENLIDCIKMLFKKEISGRNYLYRFDDTYRLIIENCDLPFESDALKEFCTNTYKSETEKMRTLEYGSFITENAVKKISDSF